jgi:hypothetical protein
MRNAFGSLAVAAVGLAMFGSPVAGQTLHASSEPSLNGFGAAVGVGQDEVFIGEPQNRIRSGIVHVYRRATDGSFAEAGQLTASDAESNDGFGAAIGVDGNTLAVGGNGAVYLFTKQGDNWSETSRLTGSDATEDDGFGSSLALSGDRLLVGARFQGQRRGAVYVFQRGASGNWTEVQKLSPEALRAADNFGAAVAIEGDLALVGAPLHNLQAGAVFGFRLEGETWLEAGTLDSEGIERGERFGSALAMRGGWAVVGAPRHGNQIGAAFGYAYDPEGGSWTREGKLVPYDGQRRDGFGAAVAFTEAEVWVGAPTARGFRGAAYVFQITGDEITSVRKLGVGRGQRGDAFASALAVGDGVALIGVSGADFGIGTARIFQRDGAGDWTSDLVMGEEESLDPIMGDQVDCSDEGNASIWDCAEVDLVSFVPVKDLGGQRGVQLNDIWGWTDPVTGKEWALVGRQDGTSFVDISNPSEPVYVGNLPLHEGANPAVWRDVKVYRDHAYIVSDGAGEHGMQVFDLTRLRQFDGTPMNFDEDAHYDRIHSAHNIVINEETGFAYSVGSSSGGETCGGGLHMIDIRDPKNPSFAGCFADSQTGRASTGYSHDAQCVVYEGPDAEHQGKEICFGSNETALSIADVSTRGLPWRSPGPHTPTWVTPTRGG